MWVMLVTTPVSIVNTDQTANDQVMTLREPNLSASQPPGIWNPA